MKKPNVPKNNNCFSDTVAIITFVVYNDFIYN